MKKSTLAFVFILFQVASGFAWAQEKNHKSAQNGSRQMRDHFAQTAALHTRKVL